MQIFNYFYKCFCHCKPVVLLYLPFSSKYAVIVKDVWTIALKYKLRMIPIFSVWSCWSSSYIESMGKTVVHLRRPISRSLSHVKV